MDYGLDIIDKYVCITLTDRSIVHGECYTVDPVTKTIIILTEICNSKNSFQPQIILSNSVTKIDVGTYPLAFQGSEYQEFKKHFLNSLSGTTVNNENYSLDHIVERKEHMKNWLEQNRLPVSLLQDDIISVVNGLALIEPPYTVDSCRSTNTIVLDRVMRIVKSCPVEFL